MICYRLYASCDMDVLMRSLVDTEMSCGRGLGALVRALAGSGCEGGESRPPARRQDRGIMLISWCILGRWISGESRGAIRVVGMLARVGRDKIQSYPIRDNCISSRRATEVVDSPQMPRETEVPASVRRSSQLATGRTNARVSAPSFPDRPKPSSEREGLRKNGC